MVKTEPVEEHLGNLGISFGNQASPGKLVSPTPRKNFFLLQYKGISVGDQVDIDGGGSGSVCASCLQRHEADALQGRRLGQ